jgi:polyferredoxin
MDKMNYPRGLISYTTENALEEKPSRIARPRTLVYATLLVALCIGFFVTLANRPMLHVDVIRDRNALYRELVDGQIENVYTLKRSGNPDRCRRGAQRGGTGACPAGHAGPR